MGMTLQRKVIMDTLNGFCGHPTAEELYECTHNVMPSIALGTVYRNLNLLAASGAIMRIAVPGQPDRFDKNPHPHDHIMCSDCGAVLDVQLGDLIASAAAKDSGWRINGYDLLIHGLCAKCALNNKINSEVNNYGTERLKDRG